MTVDKPLADEIVAANGELYPGEKALLIVEYDNAWGGKGYGVVMQGERNPGRYLVPTPFIQNPVIYWEHPDSPRKDS